MATYDPKNFSKSPYFDDYDETKKFLRILFKPGRAVQARELTQLQTISQNQITRFGNHLFKEGSQVFDGQVADIPCKFLRVEKQYNGVDINTDMFKNSTISLLGSSESSVEGDKIVNPSRAKVLHIEKATTADPYHIFFIEYEDSVTGSSSDEFTNSDTLTKISYNSSGEVLNTQYRCTVKTATTLSDKIYTTGDSVLVSNDEGVFYVEGYFVLTAKQTVPLFKTARKLSTVLGTTLGIDDEAVEIENTTAPGDTPTKWNDSLTNYAKHDTNQQLVGIRLFQFPTAKVGFSISREAVESTEDVTLLDNAFGSYNYSAPGGDRYKIDLTLSQVAFPNILNEAKLTDYTTDDFLEKLRVIDGVVTYLEKYPTYSNFEETLARRTHDESGNYTVRPFETEIREYFRDDRHVLTRSTPLQADGTSPTSYAKNDIVVGTNPDASTFLGVVVHDDMFLDRENERVDLTSSEETPVVYGTTVVYILSGTPAEGATLKLNDESGGQKNSTIITTAQLKAITDGLLQPDGSVYAVSYPPIQLINDDKNGLYTLARLAPAVDNALTDVTNAKAKLAVGMGLGKAYVFGYEFENQSVEYLTLPKSRTTNTTTDQEVVNGIGNFLLCDLVTGQENWYADPASHYYVELWGATGGWPTGTDGDGNTVVFHPTEEQLEKKGTARVRNVNYNFASDDIIDEKLAQVYLYDINLQATDKLADVAEIRLYNATGPQHKVNVNFGVEESYIGEELVGGETILFDRNNNQSIFCLPTRNSTKTVTTIDSYETRKTVTDCQFVASGNHYYLQSSNTQSDTYFLKLADYEDTTELWSGAVQSSSSLPAGWGLPVSVYNISSDDDNTNTVETKYALLNKTTGRLYDLSDSSKFLVVNKSDSRNKLGIWAKGAEFIDTTNNSYALVGASQVGTGGVNHIRTKTMKSIVSLRDTNDAQGIDYSDWFSSSTGPEGVAGYYKVTLKNAFIGDVYGATGPYVFGGQTWSDATSIVGNAPYFDGASNPTLPREYYTDLGFSDISDVTDILVWYKDDSGNFMLKDVTEEFEFDDGSSDNLYDHAKIVISRSQLFSLYNKGYFQGPTGPIDATLYVRFKFFEHTGAGPVIVNSYDHGNHHPDFGGFEDIPVHTSPQFGERMELRNCIDYRPLRKNITSKSVALAYDSTNPTYLDTLAPIVDNFNTSGDASASKDSLTSLLKPSATVSSSQHLPKLNYDSYLPRFDKIALRKTREFAVITGSAGIDPQPPEDEKEAMTLYSIAVPEYTYNAEDVLLTYIDRQRYTMEDIAKLEKRIEKIEYYTSLNLLEKETSELSITDAVDGQERFKNGILVDNFKGHGVGDVLHRDYNCSIDFENGEMRPKFNAYNLNLPDPEDLANTNVTKSEDGLLTLRYKGDGKGTDATSLADPPRWLVQPVASHAISVNPFNVTNWLGSLKLSPSSDTWKDTTRKPTVKVNLEGENDAWEAMGARASGTQWNDWETTWSGTKIQSQSSSTRSTRKYLDRPHTRRAPDGRMRRRLATQNTTVTKTTSVTTRKQTRTGIRTTIVPERVTKNLGDRIVDVSIVPFIRNKVVTISADSMKPNTQVYPFFDDINVSQYCEYNGVSGGVIVTDDTGKVTNLRFSIPAGVFKTGEREFRLTDSATNNVKNAGTSAEATYFAQGLLQTKQSTIVSTRVPTIKRQSVSDTKVVRDVVTRSKTTTSNTGVKWVDPLAQTFLVDGQAEPDGIWVHSIDLFLARKPQSGIPIKVQIRPTVNGYPHSSVVLPFAEAVVEQVDVKTTKALTEATVPSPDNPDTYTRFKFTSPVYLTPDEYSLVVMSNSDEYECYIAEMGEERVGPSTERITQQPYNGVFFKSQNASTWSADQNVDLMFCINKCEFEGVDQTGGYTLTFKNDTIDDYAGDLQVDTMRVISDNVQFEKSPLTLVLPDAEPEITNYEVPFNENINLSASKKVNTSADKLEIKVNVDTSTSSLSPVIDLDRFNVLAVSNIVEGGQTDWQKEESAPFAPITDAANKRTRYITRRVELEEGVECDDFKVYLTGHRPTYLEDGDIQPTHIRVWLKAQKVGDNSNFENLPWWQMELDPGQENLFSETPEQFFEYEYKVPTEYYDVETDASDAKTGYNEVTEMFDSPVARYAFKITLHTGNSTYIPKVKNFRTIAVT